jgi:hypothetical protein
MLLDGFLWGLGFWGALGLVALAVMNAIILIGGRLKRKQDEEKRQQHEAMKELFESLAAGRQRPPYTDAATGKDTG